MSQQEELYIRVRVLRCALLLTWIRSWKECSCSWMETWCKTWRASAINTRRTPSPLSDATLSQQFNCDLHKEKYIYNEGSDEEIRIPVLPYSTRRQIFVRLSLQLEAIKSTTEKQISRVRKVMKLLKNKKTHTGREGTSYTGSIEPINTFLICNSLVKAFAYARSLQNEEDELVAMIRVDYVISPNIFRAE